MRPEVAAEVREWVERAAGERTVGDAGWLSEGMRRRSIH